jgi:hypothetical protein
MNKSWDNFISNDTDLYMTNEGPKTDDPDGSGCRGPQLLRTVWKKPWRVETELTEERDEVDGQIEPTRPGQSHEGNAVTKFLTDPTHRDATIGAHRLHEQLAHHARRTTNGKGTTIEPTFITGKIKKGIKDGDPCTTHQDAYENHLINNHSRTEDLLRSEAIEVQARKVERLGQEERTTSRATTRHDDERQTKGLETS